MMEAVIWYKVVLSGLLDFFHYTPHNRWNVNRRWQNGLWHMVFVWLVM